jgi:cell volume regulation protein A
VEFANQLILLGAFLLLLSIFVGLVSSRIGAPLLLAFLGLGIFFGEDGPGGIFFDNYFAAYTIGTMALAIILFDGGLRTEFRNFRAAAWPALLLATVGVVVTALLTGVAARLFLGFGWVESILIGSIVSSTDAAAVFFLLNLHGLEIKPRVRSLLEIEAAINDPVAIFLTVSCVELLVAGDREWSWFLPLEFINEFIGGAALGVIAGFVLVWLINRLDLAAGLYPVLAMAFTLFTFGGAQVLGASGYMAVYFVGLVVGNRRHRATQLIARFHDGLAWLAQMVMFVMLGLLVTPSHLLPMLVPAVLIALFMVLIARPVATVLCLLPFRFAWNEHAFVGWVGLRGAVAIFLGTIPVLAGVENATAYFEVAFVVVLVSLIVQGWTLAPAARLLDVELPPSAKTPERIDVDLPASAGRDLMIYTVGPGSRISVRGVRRLLQVEDTSLVGVVRDGRLLRPRDLDRLDPGDSVLVIAPPEQAGTLDEMFAERPESAGGGDVFGEFTFGGDLPVGKLAEFYDLPVSEAERAALLADFLQTRLRRKPLVGDRIPVGDIELIVRGVRGERITEVGIELEPTGRPRPSWTRLRSQWRRALVRLRQRLGLSRRGSETGVAHAVNPGEGEQKREERHRDAAPGVLGEGEDHAGIAGALEGDDVGKASDNEQVAGQSREHGERVERPLAHGGRDRQQEHDQRHVADGVGADQGERREDG